MRVLQVHNRYRSAAPSGENRVADRERTALAALGHEVTTFGPSSDEIEGWSRLQQAALPARVVWSRAARRDLGRELAARKPDVYVRLTASVTGCPGVCTKRTSGTLSITRRPTISNRTR